MYPEDRVLVGVINRKRDFEKLQVEHWYRVPQGQAGQGIYAEYIAFFFSRAFGELNGGIHYYARRTGIELVRRCDLLPDEPTHPRAHALYYKLQIGELRPKDPPVLNAGRRVVSFVHTTWDRFVAARDVADLYSDDEDFVDRVFYALARQGIRAERISPGEGLSGPQLRIPCREGIVLASTTPLDGDHVLLPTRPTVERSVGAILAAVKRRGGPLTSRDNAS
ncbi:MAG: hypothetical protein Kow00106_16650 [Anaerolineae bacterium]